MPAPHVPPPGSDDVGGPVGDDAVSGRAVPTSLSLPKLRESWSLRFNIGRGQMRWSERWEFTWDVKCFHVGREKLGHLFTWDVKCPPWTAQRSFGWPSPPSIACGGTTKQRELDSPAIQPAFFASLIALLTEDGERGAPGVPNTSAISPALNCAWPLRRWHPKARAPTLIQSGSVGFAARLAARSRHTAWRCIAKGF